MMITVTFRRMEPTESLRAYAEEKLSKIKKYLDSPMEAHAVLEVEKFRHMADVTVNVDGTRIKAYEETEDMYSAIDMVMDKIENQVKKHRARLRERRAENIKGEQTLGSERRRKGYRMNRPFRSKNWWPNPWIPKRQPCSFQHRGRISWSSGIHDPEKSM